MNTVLLELNSYTQKARIFLDGREPSSYSELKNYSYKQIVEKPRIVLDAISRELNDDFSLSVIAPTCIYNKIAAVAREVEYCDDCAQTAPKIDWSSKERLERLAENVPQTALSVLLTGVDTVPKPCDYGAISLSFTADEDADADFQINFIVGSQVPPSGKGYVNIAVAKKDVLTASFVLDICEAYFLNPFIGKSVEQIGSDSKEVLICSSLNPIVTAVCHDKMSVGIDNVVVFEVYPEVAEMPKIEVVSSNNDVLLPGNYHPAGCEVKPLTEGEVELRAFIKGERVPFFAEKVLVEKTVWVEKIEILDFNEVLSPGKTVVIQTTVYPFDAEDANGIVFESSNPGIAEVVGGKLKVKVVGEFTLTAKGESCRDSRSFTVLPGLVGLSLSHKEVSINVGGKAPIAVNLTPKDAHNADYSWATSDETVAKVVVEGGKEYIKAVGIGSCTLECSAKSAAVKDSCTVTVNSVLYQKNNPVQRKRYIILAIIVFIILFGKDLFNI